MDIWYVIIPSVAFFLGMAVFGSYISEGLSSLGASIPAGLALWELENPCDDDTISEEVPDEGIRPTGYSPPRTY